MSMNGTVLSREAILAAGTSASVTVPIPALGGNVALRALTVAEVESLDGLEGKDFGLAAAMLSIVDEAGDRVFGVDDLPAFKELPSTAVAELVSAATKLNNPSAEGN